MVMNILLVFSHLYVTFVGASGFLLGQLMFGQFSIVATLVGVAGVLVGFSGFAKNGQQVNRFVVGCCCVGILGVAAMAVLGNGFGGVLTGPFIVALALICYTRAVKNTQYYKK